MKKKLIVSGDSVSDLEFRSSAHPEIDTSWPKWPEYVAKHLDMELVCLARGGQGNTFVYSTLLDKITTTPKEEIGLVIAGWSQAHRRDWQVFKGDPGFHPTDSISRQFFQKHSWVSNINDMRDHKNNIESHTQKSLREMYSFQILCERYDLPYLQFQTGHLFEDWWNNKQFHFQNDQDKLDGLKTNRHQKTKVKKSIRRCLDIILSYENIIDTNRFIGWPLSYNIGGFDLENKIIGDSQKQKAQRGLYISEKDYHPNRLGQKAIGEYIIEFYENL
jgi:hypothetical protein